MPRLDYVVIVWSMTAASGAVLAAVHLMAWMSERRRASLAFVALTASVAMFAVLELAMMRTPSPAAFATTLRWAHVVILMMVVSVVGFVRETFPEQRGWLGITAVSLRALAVAANFLNGNANLNFVEVSAMRNAELFDAAIMLPVGVPSHWTRLGELASLLLFAYVVDAAIRHGRAGGEARRRAWALGGGMALFVGCAPVLVFLAHVGLLKLPYMVSLPYLGVAFVMAWQLSRDMVSATRLSHDLAESERRAALAAAAARAGFWSWYPGERRLWADAVARRLHGADAAEDVATFLAHVEPTARPALDGLLAADAPADFELEYPVVAGSAVRWIRSRGTIDRSAAGVPLVVRGGSIDVTEWREADLRFRGVVEAAPTALFVIAGDGAIMLANHRAEEMFGAARDALVGRPVTELAAIGWPRSAEWGRGLGQNEHRAHRLDGSEFIVEVGISEIPASGGKQFLASMLDATQRLEHEREMQRLREQFATASRISLAGQLASTLAHELSQPLAAILRNAETAGILLERKEPDLAELEAILDDIRSDDRRAADIIEHMRSLLRGRGPQLAPVALPELLRRVAAVVRHDAELRDVKVTVEAAANLPEVMADSTQLQQVLLNLVYNSLHALEAVPPNARHVGLHARVVQDHVEVAVSDTGPGIASAALPRIFDAFFSTKSDGMGMGLAICRSLVDAMGGSIEARNAMGGGAVFRISLRPAAVTA